VRAANNSLRRFIPYSLLPFYYQSELQGVRTRKKEEPRKGSIFWLLFVPGSCDYVSWATTALTVGGSNPSRRAKGLEDNDRLAIDL